VLRELLANLPKPAPNADLLVGYDTGDDAAVYRIDEERAMVATTDFFSPPVDDPFDFGRIAATNALSDVYAVGGRPVLALAIVGMPIDKVSTDTIQRVLAGGASVCKDAGVPIAGGHSIDTLEPIYGLAAIGMVDIKNIKRNVGARPGDALILGKGIGTGFLASAMKAGTLSPDGYREMIDCTTRLNDIGAELGERPDIHAMTDITGFGLLGHLSEICQGSDVAARVELDAVPMLTAAQELARTGVNTGATGRNRVAFGADVALPDGLPEWCNNMLYDPQTAGPLLVACDPGAAGEILALFHARGYAAAAIIGHCAEHGAGEPHIVVK
jgi:selenide, water dikinase